MQVMSLMAWCVMLCAAAPVETELAWLQEHVPKFTVIDLPADAVDVTLRREQSLYLTMIRRRCPKHVRRMTHGLRMIYLPM